MEYSNSMTSAIENCSQFLAQLQAIEEQISKILADKQINYLEKNAKSLKLGMIMNK